MKQTWLVGILASALLVGPTVVAQGQKPAAAPPKGEAPTGETMLGSVSIPRNVTADGKPLARGTYQVRLTAQNAPSPAPGATPSLERWVEFVQGGQVRGREVVSIVPAGEMKDLMPGPDDKRVVTNAARVEMLKGNEFLRVWINRGGVNYLIHLVPAA
jgi:hypothetical protein